MKTRVFPFNLPVEYSHQSSRLEAVHSVFRELRQVQDEEVCHSVSMSGTRLVRLAAIKIHPADNTHISTAEIERLIAMEGYRSAIFAELYEVGLALSLSQRGISNAALGSLLQDCWPMVALGTRLVGKVRSGQISGVPISSSRLRPEYLKSMKPSAIPREESFFILSGVNSVGALFSYSGVVDIWPLNSCWFLAGL